MKYQPRESWPKMEFIWLRMTGDWKRGWRKVKGRKDRQMHEKKFDNSSAYSSLLLFHANNKGITNTGCVCLQITKKHRNISDMHFVNNCWWNPIFQRTNAKTNSQRTKWIISIAVETSYPGNTGDKKKTHLMTQYKSNFHILLCHSA